MHINQHQHRATCLHLESRSRLPSSAELHYDYACVSCIIIIIIHDPSSIFHLAIYNSRYIPNYHNNNRARRLLGAVDLASSQPKAPLCLSTLPAHTHTDTRCTMPIPTHHHTHTAHSTQNTAGRSRRPLCSLGQQQQTNKHQPTTSVLLLLYDYKKQFYIIISSARSSH